MGFGLTVGANTTDRVDCGSGASVDDLTALTAVVHEYPTTLTSDRTLIGKYRGAGATGWQLRNGLSGVVIVEVGRATQSVVQRSSSLARSTGQWYCTACTIDRAATPVAHIYIGDLATAMAEPSYDLTQDGSGSFNSDAARVLMIGNRDAATPNGAYIGTLALASLFNRVLTLAEIEQLRLRPMAAAHMSGCVGAWILGNGGSIGTQVDLTGSGNDGAVTGCTASSTQIPLALHGRLAGGSALRSLVGGGLAG